MGVIKSCLIKEEAEEKQEGREQQLAMDVVFETPEGRAFSMEVWFFATVLEMKQKIHQHHGFPVSRQTLVFDGRVMEDGRDTKHYGVLHGSRIHLFLDPPRRPLAGAEAWGVEAPRLSPVAAAAAAQSKRLRLSVLLPPPQWGSTAASSRKVAVEVNGADNVSELRKELQRLQGSLGFELPAEGYFLIYKQNVMDEDRTFRWHDVRQGDAIEIFNGSVTSG
ncbi:hypothetical protein Taro_007825 [Colocasia esculenta]|uniref:Ubiquitin-like domain-containing protein n=1 Tax=Colocasia esculenta TaxID=4460 RepID=A0A843U0P9_COLES|nr:hypothetical protein [Colocasia esculenta]